MKLLNRDKVLALTMLILLLCAFLFMRFNALNNTYISDSIIRVIYSIVIVLIIYGFRLKIFGKNKNFLTTLFMVLPALLISINNFPISAYFNQRTEITSSTPIYQFLLQCISIGIFEELLFRGLILMILIDYLKNQKHHILKAMFISSILFGLMHLFNLFAGAGFSATLLQVAYSILTGLMWSAVFILTKNIIYSIILHIIYNFAGLLFPTLGIVTKQFDVITVVVTVLLSVSVSIFYLIHILKVKTFPIENQTFFHK